MLTLLLAAGAVGEEMFFRGYGFQVLLATCGPWATVVPVGVVFALLHSANPNATWLGIVNTAGFGILFGYAYLRSRDLWLPIGLHFGWNFTLPLFGVNVSGLRMRMTGHEMVWTAGKLWSGGDYGPEASLLTSGVMVLLFSIRLEGARSPAVLAFDRTRPRGVPDASLRHHRHPEPAALVLPGGRQTDVCRTVSSWSAG